MVVVGYVKEGIKDFQRFQLYILYWYHWTRLKEYDLNNIKESPYFHSKLDWRELGNTFGMPEL